MAAQPDNLSLVLVKKGELQLEQRPIPKPGENDVLVAVHSVGICGSDVHYWVHGRIGHFIVTEPLTLGHESSGTVVQVGSGVKSLKPGDRVAMEPGVACRYCKFCKSGRYNLCPDIKFCATPPVNDHVSYEEGALLEPLAVAVNACRRGRITFGEKILVIGSGPIGLLTMLVAKAAGASVCITDINESRLKFAKEMGADHTLFQAENEGAAAVVAKLELLLGTKPDATIECCGAESCVRLGLMATESGGRLVLVGCGPPEVKIPLMDACLREVDLIGNFRYCNCYPTALALVASGKVNVKPLITHHFNLEQSLEAFDVSRTGRDGAIKVMIKCKQT